jgi:hypothetical protein
MASEKMVCSSKPHRHLAYGNTLYVQGYMYMSKQNYKSSTRVNKSTRVSKSKCNYREKTRSVS